ncbi:DUF7344 domain-containing protein [Halobaculum rubrum]|uniref:DUF7344 domain-containing protein n=1 Tax=Halobaculum rubrum TaxID=2872158 RepID=UPI001CA4270B|nr:hypothetical protein [Halobaculum rubrum]QZX99162.1 hypothetical protein K6T25_12990 [Halobaculum rubrum]
MMGDRFDSDGVGSTDHTSTRGVLPTAQTTCPDFVFDALAAERRRTICRVLDEEGARDLDDLAIDVATVEHTAAEPGVTNEECETVYASLYHQHVPKLTSLDVVRFDPDDATVAPGERFAAVVAALDAVETVLDEPVASRGING